MSSPPPTPPAPPSRHPPWHARGEVRLGAAVLALLLIAAAAAALRGGGDTPSEGQRADGGAVRIAGAPATTEATATATATASPTVAAIAPSAAPATAPAAASPAATATPPATPMATASPSPTATPSAKPSATSSATSPKPSATSSATSPKPSSTPSATSPKPSASATAPAPAIAVRPERVGTGETLVVEARTEAASTARLEFRGGSYTLLPHDGGFWGVFAVPLTAALGPEPLTVTLLDAAGTPLASLDAAYEVVDLGRAIDYITLTAEQASVLTAEASTREAELRSEQFAEFDREVRWAGSFAPPVAGPLTSAFGVGRSFNDAPVSGFHGGADYGGAEGTPVLAAGPGRVSWAGAMPIRGNAVLLDHGAGVKTGYHHLSRIDVAVGDVVATGGELGAIGQTGLVTGPHLHWELTIWGVNVDPVTWLGEAFVPLEPPEVPDAP